MNLNPTQTEILKACVSSKTSNEIATHLLSVGLDRAPSYIEKCIGGLTAPGYLKGEYTATNGKRKVYTTVRFPEMDPAIFEGQSQELRFQWMGTVETLTNIFKDLNQEGSPNTGLTPLQEIVSSCRHLWIRSHSKMLGKDKFAPTESELREFLVRRRDYYRKLVILLDKLLDQSTIWYENDPVTWRRIRDDERNLEGYEKSSSIIHKVYLRVGLRPNPVTENGQR